MIIREVPSLTSKMMARQDGRTITSGIGRVVFD
jgi:hypothetical protein